MNLHEIRGNTNFMTYGICQLKLNAWLFEIQSVILSRSRLLP